MFISEAFAQTAGASAGGTDMVNTMVQLALIFVIFYFLLIRPQQKKIKQHEALLSTVKRGDKVLTGGGIVGEVERVVGEEVEVKIANDVVIKVYRSTLRDIIKDVPAVSKVEEKSQKADKKSKAKK